MFVIIHTQKICGVLKTRTTVKGSSYVNHIRRFREAVKKKESGKVRAEVLFYQDTKPKLQWLPFEQVLNYFSFQI